MDRNRVKNANTNNCNHDTGTNLQCRLPLKRRLQAMHAIIASTATTNTRIDMSNPTPKPGAWTPLSQNQQKSPYNINNDNNNYRNINKNNNNRAMSR